MENKLHIISFDVPLPANYGGVMDVYYKLKSLSEAGVEITLHCFTSASRKENHALNDLCKKVYYYPRIVGWRGICTSLPYIISSRRNREVLKNLLLDECPILFEGIHTTYLAKHPALKNRRKILRAHNIEHEYYRHLFDKENNLFKKIYFGLETFLLKKYESDLSVYDLILPISETETNFFLKKNPNVRWLPAYHPHDVVHSAEGKGNYCLYHGNLSVSENEEAALFLIQEVFSNLKIPLVIAGKNPSTKILDKTSSHIQIIPNPGNEELEVLIRNAHIHVLPSFQTNGVKLKLLHALYAGRFCIVNDTMLEGSGISGSVIKANSAEEFKNQIQKYMELDFGEKEIQERKFALEQFSMLTPMAIERILGCSKFLSPPSLPQ